MNGHFCYMRCAHPDLKPHLRFGTSHLSDSTCQTGLQKCGHIYTHFLASGRFARSDGTGPYPVKSQKQNWHTCQICAVLKPIPAGNRLKYREISVIFSQSEFCMKYGNLAQFSRIFPSVLYRSNWHKFCTSMLHYGSE